MMKKAYKTIIATQLLVLAVISKGTSMDVPTNESDSTLPTTSAVTNHSPINNPVDLDCIKEEPLLGYISNIYKAFYNPNNPEYKLTGETDEQGRQIYIEFINEMETGDRYVEEVDQNGRLLSLTKISK